MSSKYRVRIWAEDRDHWFGLDGPLGCLGVPDEADELGIIIGQPGYEFPLPEGADEATHDYGRTYNDCTLTEYQINHVLGLLDGTERRARVTKYGTFEGPEWPFPTADEL